MKGILVAVSLSLVLCSGCLYPPQSTCESGPGTPLSYASGAPVPQACQDWESLSPAERVDARVAHDTAVASQPQSPSLNAGNSQMCMASRLGQVISALSHGPGVTGTPASCYAAMGYSSPPVIYETAPRHCTSTTGFNGMVTTNCN
jgi:hypothetical protein